MTYSSSMVVRMEGNEYIRNVTIRFYAELNDFIRPVYRYKPAEFLFKGRITVRGAIESLGVPHSAVDLVIINGKPARFSKIINQGDHLSVYPEFESFDISGISKNRKKPIRTSRFMLDAHLGKLTKKLRLLGFDSVFAGGIVDEEIIDTARTGKRIILTRDRELLKSDRVDHGYYIRATMTDAQLKEVIAKFDLRSQFDPFSRCLECNGELVKADLPQVKEMINPGTAQIFDAFFRCSACGRIYWEGSHYKSMTEYISRL